jgi:hypothetical protein
MRLNAAQHVSAVLTSKQSPRGRGGYQTILHTEGTLTNEEIYLLERQVQYVPAPNSGIRWQFYRLTPRRHVVTRVVPISEPDESGRRGRFFSHSLIFDVATQKEFDEISLDILQPCHFFPSLDRILAVEDLKAGHIHSISVEAQREWEKEAQSFLREWTGEQLNHLSMLTGDPRELTGHGQYVAIVGNEAQIVEALKVTYLLTPTESRQFCAFDTNVLGSKPHPDVSIWARGFPQATSVTGTPFVINAAQRRVVIPKSSGIRANHFSPEQLSPAMRQLIDHKLGQPTDQMLKCLCERRYKAFVGELVYQSLLHETDMPMTESDLELLMPFGQAHHGLSLLLALQSGDHPQRLRSLAGMRDWAEYKKRITELKTRPDVKPWQLFSPGFMSTWFDTLRDYNMQDVTQAVASVSEHGSANDRQQLLCLDEQLRGGERQELARWLASTTHRLERLQAALNRPIAANGTRLPVSKLKSFWRRLRRSFTR